MKQAPSEKEAKTMFKRSFMSSVIFSSDNSVINWDSIESVNFDF